MTVSKNKLLISEDFYSVQCEGVSSGVPSYFIRLADCNLSCGVSMNFVNQFKKEKRVETAGDFQGDLHQFGQASWTCDTIPVWARGTEREFDYLIKRWEEEDIYKDILSGLIHIIWTGGEPTLPKHQEAIFDFIVFLQGKSSCVSKGWFYNPFYEIETNGTLLFQEKLFRFLNQINCSPKLSNSGMTEKQRIKPDVITQICTHKRSQFKFVVSTEEDIQEMFDTFITPFKLPLSKVVCMPGLDSQENFHERTRFILEMAKKYKFIGLTRLHVSAWDKTVGV